MASLSIIKKRTSTFLRTGFTLIELLIVVTIISTLAVTVFVALDPAKRIKDAKDARRTSDVDSILTAIHQFIVDNKGSFPSNMPLANSETQLGNGASGCTISTGGCSATGAAVCADLLTGSTNLAKYLKSMPIDPSGGTTYTASKAGYTVTLDSNNIVTIKACGAENTTIASSR